MIIRFFGTIGTLLFLASALSAAAEPPLPSCARSIEIAGVRVIRVEKNGVLVLEDGRAARLEGLILPGEGGDQGSLQFAAVANQVLTGLVVGREVSLAAEPPKEDRYGRLRAQVFVGDDNGWVQLEMLHRGLARVSIAPDRRECASLLYAAEDAARRSRSGIWTQTAYVVRSAEDALFAQTDTFQIVTGKVVSASVRNGRAYLDFGADWRKDFTVTISSQDMRNFRQAGVDPQSYEGKTVRVRGWVETLHRPEIEVAVPEDIEVLDAN
jgi:endonuclease YncB( thermonuclease family)